MHSLDELITEIEREISIRTNNYPTLVKQGTMRQSEMNQAISKMRQIKLILVAQKIKTTQTSLLDDV